jgi:hypothetical protein
MKIREVIGQLYGVETIAVGSSIRDLARLRRVYGSGRWRKLKGFGKVVTEGGRIRSAEVHGYEARNWEKGTEGETVPGLIR